MVFAEQKYGFARHSPGPRKWYETSRPNCKMTNYEEFYYDDMERYFPKMVKLTLTPTNLFSGGKMSIETVLMDFHVVPCLDELVYVRYDKAGGSTIVSKSLMMLLRDVATVATCVAEALRQDCLEQVHASCMGQNILLLKSFIPHQYFFTLYVLILSPYPLKLSSGLHLISVQLLGDLQRAQGLYVHHQTLLQVLRLLFLISSSL